ncbi:MAG: ABC transporter substrate-binding protein [Acidimicrobiales bacterium]|jgi:peptide/nickel transport system substrate-binding protein
MTVTVRFRGASGVSSNYDRREFLGKGLKAGAAFTVLGGAGAALDACGSTSGGPTTTLKKVSKGQALKIGAEGIPPKSAKLGGSITFGTEAEEAGMDPTYSHFDSTGVLYARCVYDPLCTVTLAGDVVPYLAESITPNSTYTVWTITVRPNIVFHDGTPCDGAALAFCMNKFKESALVNFALTYWVKNAVKQVGPRTITITMNAPWVSFPAWLCGYIGGQVAYIFSPKQYSRGENVLALHPVGTGPFMLKQWNVGSYFECVRNPHYWRKDAYGRQLPYLDSWTYKPLIEVQERFDQLESNQLQLMHTDDDPTIISIAQNKSLESLRDDELSVGEPDCGFGMIQVQDPVMKDIRLRKALACAMNQAQYCEGIGRGVVHATSGPFPSPSPYFSDTGYPGFNLPKAISLVKSWSADHGGQVPSITYTTTTSSTSQTAAAYVQSLFQAAGFKVTVSQVQQSALIDDALGGKYQIFSWRQFANIDPDLNYVFWTKAAGVVNFARNFDPKIDSAMDKARQSTNPQVRLEAYQAVAERMAVDLPYIWADRDVWCVAAQKTVQNWNNPSTPLEGGATVQRGLTMLSGIIFPTEVWTTPV